MRTKVTFSVVGIKTSLGRHLVSYFSVPGHLLLERQNRVPIIFASHRFVFLGRCQGCKVDGDRGEVVLPTADLVFCPTDRRWSIQEYNPWYGMVWYDSALGTMCCAERTVVHYGMVEYFDEPRATIPTP